MRVPRIDGHSVFLLQHQQADGSAMGVSGAMAADPDVPPHPGVVAAVLVIISLRTLTAPLRRAAA